MCQNIINLNYYFLFLLYSLLYNIQVTKLKNYTGSMGQALPLTTDQRQISSIVSTRVLVASALLYCYTAHYVFIAISYFFERDTKRVAFQDMGRRLVIYGIAALLSVNFLQYGIYHAICAWVLFITIVVLEVLNFMRDVSQRAKNVGLLIYYILMFIWFFGILFFYLFNALNDNTVIQDG